MPNHITHRSWAISSARHRQLLVLAVQLFLLIALAENIRAVEYKFSMLPLFETEESFKRITPFADYLSKETGLKITPIITANFSQYGQQISSGAIQIGYQNPYVYAQHSAFHEAIAMASTGGNGFTFRGIIITRINSPIRNLIDLKGKRISIVSLSSTGGFLSQSYSLAKAGIRLLDDCTIEEATENKHENVIFSVVNGDVDAGFIQEVALSQVKDFVPVQEIKILERTEWLPNWALSLSKNMPETDRKKIISAIERLAPGSPPLKALKVDAFRLTNDGAYDSIRVAAGIAK